MKRPSWLLAPDGSYEHRSAMESRLDVARTSLEVIDDETPRAQVERLAKQALGIFARGLTCGDAALERTSARDIMFAYEKIMRNAPPEEAPVVVDLDRREQLIRLLERPPPAMIPILEAAGWQKRS